MDILRNFIKALISEAEKKQSKEERPDKLLTEPDETDGREESEVSSGGVAGVATPLGTGPNYPNKTRRYPGTRTPHEVAAAAFGGSKIKK